MRIKQIELNGFKSFMERTVLELPAGVTAIVGPNGCGKSNVVDAIRWVLGEQSPKHLRGAAMEDVVFAGNAENGPLGMAEVSLLLERDESDLVRAAADAAADQETVEGLPPELANVSEILVTRRYFRSGESEYFINRAACRLKDITELFLGTGVGTKAYAIIEQGRVDQLVNAKPEELRLFLEEAAGTTRFRSRRLSAERKMERTRENLSRVQDVLHELERQRASLERQARRAEEYHRIKGELRDLDLRVMAARHRVWSAELAGLGERLVALQGEEAALHEAIDRARGITTEVRAARAASAERLRTVEEELTGQRLAAGEAHARAASLVARAHDAGARADEAAREAERLQERLVTVGAEATLLRSEGERLAGEEPAVETDAARAAERLAELAARGVPLERALEEDKDALLDALNEASRLQNVASALHRRREELEGRRRKLEDEQRELGERLHANGQRAETLRGTIARLGEERATIAEERRTLVAAERELAALAAEQALEVERRRAETMQLRSRAESLRELQVRYEGCTRGAASILGREGRAAVLVASLLHVPAELERAVAAALGGRLSQVVVPDTLAAVEAIGWLRETVGGSATILPRDPERRAPAIVPAGRRLLDCIEVDAPHWALAEALLGHVLLADDLDGALGVWRAADHAVTVVTPRGEAIDALGGVTGGSEAPLEETLLVRQRELRDLERVLAGSAERLAAAEAELGEVHRRLDGLRTADVAADEKLQAVRVELVAAEKDREQIEAERLRITAELEVSALEAGGLAGEDGEVSGELATLDTRTAEAAHVVAERRQRLAARQAALTQWREESAAAERQRTEVAVRAAALTERLRAVRADVTRTEAARHELEERIAGLTRQATEVRATTEAARRDAATAEAEARDAETRATLLDEERGRLVAAIAEAEARASADDASEREARERLEAAREERARIEVAAAEHRMELDHLAAQLGERYALDIAVLADVPLEEDGRDDERAARVEALRARLTRLGDVNPAAIDELEELRARHEFLDGQRRDLERSLDDLRKTIAKLARTSRQRFEETFTLANEKLADVFPKLFPGGQARLEMTEAVEGGEAGVEIVVQPSGKKLQSLSLLSGGEKAMTAVALILSLFLIRPTPFCLLDEVDAPLDEANIGRFNQLVREMASTSQFVLITHNRRTMEVADTLYGITMEQAGISKVVSVRLREAA